MKLLSFNNAAIGYPKRDRVGRRLVGFDGQRYRLRVVDGQDRLGCSSRRQRRRKRWGFSLLEVILSIVILAGCLAVLGELIRVGTRSARSARELTTAQMLCESMMAEIHAGIAPTTSTEGVTEHFDGSLWTYTVVAEQVDQEGLMEVVVQVQQDLSAVAQPVTCTLTRWFVDPQLITDLATVDAELAAARAEQSASSDTSGGTAETSGDSSGTDSGGGR